jgi:hypothetical protein
MATVTVSGRASAASSASRCGSILAFFGVVRPVMRALVVWV